MQHFDNEMKMYAKQGLRSMAEWRSMGRQVAVNSTPRAIVGSKPPVELFSRDQTQVRVSERREGGAGAAAAAAPAATPVAS